MQHLLTEFSAESLLCIVECWQMKLYFLHVQQQAQEQEQEHKQNLSGEDLTQTEFDINPTLHGFILPDSELPHSSIVWDSANSFKMKTEQLIEKYITSGSEFAVNISSRCRKRVLKSIKQMSEHDYQRMYALFDDVLIDLLELLADSHQRFVLTPQYKKLEESDK
jgi:hypothetical protein